MRCPKCQYLGFEPSPRCKNCGYDVSFSGDDLRPASAESSDSLGDFDLQGLDNPSARSSPRGGFDLDDLLARDRFEPAPATRSSTGVSTASAVATPQVADLVLMTDRADRPEEAPSLVEASTTVITSPVLTPIEPTVTAASSVASAPVPTVKIQVPLADPIVRPAPIVTPPVAAAAPVPARREPPAPVTTELPLFMQTMSDVKERVSVPATNHTAPVEMAQVERAGMPMTVEAATEAAGAIDLMAPEVAVEAEPEIDDRPLVEVPAVLRPPLAVRRTTPDPARLRAKYARASARTESNAAGDLLQGIDDLDLSVQAPQASQRLSAEPTPESLPAGWLQGVSAGKRLSAALVDGLLLGSLNAAILWFTLSVAGIAPSQAHLLPIVPIGLFLLLMDGGYMVLFTAACGQTIGKMAAGIRVVGTTTGAVINDRISIGQAVARSIGAIASFLPLGAGLWITLFGDGRAFHDRIAHTRVVRA